MLDTFVKLLLSTGVDNYVATHDWVWPVCEIIHFFGMFMLIGSVGLVDLGFWASPREYPLGRWSASFRSASSVWC